MQLKLIFTLQKRKNFEDEDEDDDNSIKKKRKILRKQKPAVSISAIY